MLLPFLPATVIRIEQATAHTRRFWLRLEGVERFDFTPGQFVTLDLPIHEKRNKRWRSYSIASEPDGTNVFELVIVQLEGGAGTRYLFEEVQEGSVLQVRGPQGVFVLHQPLLEPLYLICTGTGIAPFRSMVQHLRASGSAAPEIHLIFGTRTRADLLYEQELRDLQEEWPVFRYHPVFSRETAGPGIRTGYVHAVYEELLAVQKPPDARFYLCGWKNMIDEAVTRLQTLGYPKQQIHFELYG